MEVVWWLHIQPGLSDDDADALKHLGVFTIYTCSAFVGLDNKLYKMHGTCIAIANNYICSNWQEILSPCDFAKLSTAVFNLISCRLKHMALNLVALKLVALKHMALKHMGLKLVTLNHMALKLVALKHMALKLVLVGAPKIGNFWAAAVFVNWINHLGLQTHHIVAHRP